MEKYYFAHFVPIGNSAYLVDFPEFNGCFTEGKTLEEAIEKAEKCLFENIQTMVQIDEEISEPLSVDEVKKLSEKKNRVLGIEEIENSFFQAIGIDDSWFDKNTIHIPEPTFNQIYSVAYREGYDKATNRDFLIFPIAFAFFVLIYFLYLK